MSWAYTRDLFGGLIMNDQKGVFRLIVVIVLFAGLLGMWTSGCQTPEQKVEKLIKKLQHKNPKVRVNAALALGQMGSEDAMPALRQALQDQNDWVCAAAALALDKIKEKSQP